jgi:DNA-binding NarL/FixJ family response regulator
MSGLGRRTVVLVDPHPLWLHAVEEVMDRVPVKVVGKSTSLDEAGHLIEEHQPELLVAETSVSELDTDGLVWLTGILQRFPEVKAIVLSNSDDPADIRTALQAGAVAYVVKKAHPDDLAVAVRQAFEHSIYLRSSADMGETVTAELQLDHPDLTRRELEILRLVAEGLSNSELAKMLWVTEQTVKFHLSNIYRKLDVSNRTEASRWAQLNGLLPAQSAARSNGGTHAFAGAAAGD